MLKLESGQSIEEAIGEKFLKLNLYELDYVVDVLIDYSRCSRHNKSAEITATRALETIAEIMNLQDSARMETGGD